MSWTAGLLSGFNDSIGEAGRKLTAAGETTAVIGSLSETVHGVRRSIEQFQDVGTQIQQVGRRAVRLSHMRLLGRRRRVLGELAGQR